uniref:Uncharacterized protein n=1 Tax=Lepeophtheirus salmonis TaxID=72036 RepID=A0A0K2TVI6_LEPSM
MIGIGDCSDASISLANVYHPIILLVVDGSTVKVLPSDKKITRLLLCFQIIQGFLTSFKTEFFLTLGQEWPLNSFKRPSSSLLDDLAHSRRMHLLLLGVF